MPKKRPKNTPARKRSFGRAKAFITEFAKFQHAIQGVRDKSAQHGDHIKELSFVILTFFVPDAFRSDRRKPALSLLPH